MASFARDMGYDTGSTGCNLPATMFCITSMSIAWFSAWFWPTHAPQSTPTTVRFVSSTKFAGRRGMPATKPTTMY